MCEVHATEASGGASGKQGTVLLWCFAETGLCCDNPGIIPQYPGFVAYKPISWTFPETGEVHHVRNPALYPFCSRAERVTGESRVPLEAAEGFVQSYSYKTSLFSQTTRSDLFVFKEI